MKPRLLDLFCGAGGCSMGYHRAGFDVTGVDNRPMPRYPFTFIQADALEYVAAHGHEYDVIHASPPCQGYSVTKSLHDKSHPMLIEPLRELLMATGKPYVIENVVGAPLHLPIMLCGLHFGLKVFRHRLFEVNPWMLAPSHLDHPADATTNSRRGYSSFEHGANFITMAGENFSRLDAVEAIGDCEWMTRKELAQSIPPAYTEYIGRQLIGMFEVAP